MSYGKPLQVGDRIKMAGRWSEWVVGNFNKNGFMGPCGYLYDKTWIQDIVWYGQTFCGRCDGTTCSHSKEAVCIAQQLIAEGLI